MVGDYVSPASNDAWCHGLLRELDPESRLRAFEVAAWVYEDLGARLRMDDNERRQLFKALFRIAMGAIGTMISLTPWWSDDLPSRKVVLKMVRDAFVERRHP